MTDSVDKFTLSINGPGITFDHEIDSAIIPTVMQLAFGSAGQASTAPLVNPGWSPGVDPRVNLDDAPGGGTPAKKPAKKAGKRPGQKKVTYDVPKDINFSPSDRDTLEAYADLKKPKTNPERALVAVHYITKVLDRPASVGAVIAAFKAMDWDAPGDPKNNLQQAGSKHWLETSDSDNITVTYGGDSQLDKMPKSAK